MKKIMSLLQIDLLLKCQVRFWRYDKAEDVRMNCWTIANHAHYGIAVKPEYETRDEAEKAFKEHLIKHFT